MAAETTITDDAMLKLLFIRHGESIGNREHRMAGHSNDGLTPEGQQQCRRLAQRLYQQRWQPSHIYTSPLRRAVESLAYLLEPWSDLLSPNLPIREGATPEKPRWGHAVTASNLQAKYTLKITASVALQEFQAGVLTDLTWVEAKRQYPTLCRQLETSKDWVAIPNAETPQQGQHRAQNFIQQLLANHRNGDAIWIVSHHWIMEHLMSALMGCDRTWQMMIPNTALFEFWLDCDRWLQTGMAQGISDLWQIKRFSDGQHLNGQSASTSSS